MVWSLKIYKIMKIDGRLKQQSTDEINMAK